MLAIAAAILFGIGFILELIHKSSVHFDWLFAFGGLFCLAVACAVAGPVIFWRRQ